MADAADRSWNYPNIFTGGAIGVGRFGFPCLRVDRPLKSDLSSDLDPAGAVERAPWTVFDRA
ncbi:MAG: hypothetical protein WCA26_06335 [Xanthobacteraceae bacterium]|jgi:hypothetical protein